MRRVDDFDMGEPTKSTSQSGQVAAERFLREIADLAAIDPAAANQILGHVDEQIELIRRFSALRGNAASIVDRAAAGVHSEGMASSEGGLGAGGGLDLGDLGRNQRSRIREAVLLEIIELNGGPCALTSLMVEIGFRGLNDSQAAVVSHLHRMKAGGLIGQPGNGFYDVTGDGLEHLRKLRATLGTLMPKRP